MKIRGAIDEFLLACAADGLRPATIRWYSSILTAFADDFQGCDLGAFTSTMIREYIVGLQNRSERYIDAPQKPVQAGGLSEASIAGHVRALHAFWSWAADEYRLDRNPMANIRRQRNPQPEPKAISPSDFVRLFNATGNDDAGKRDRAMLAFLADTGCRLGGLLALALDNLFLDQHRAIVQEKGGNTRPVVFTGYTERALRQWLTVRQSRTDHVFISMTTGRPLTASGIHQILRRLKARANVKGRVNPHSFRHNFAREYLRNGGDLATLARLLGHSDISTTASYYAVFSQDELAEFHEKFSPLRRLGLRDA